MSADNLLFGDKTKVAWEVVPFLADDTVVHNASRQISKTVNVRSCNKLCGNVKVRGSFLPHRDTGQARRVWKSVVREKSAVFLRRCVRHTGLVNFRNADEVQVTHVQTL